MDCTSCKERTPEPVPYVAHERDMARLERANKRLTAIVIICILAIIGFVFYVSQFQIVTTTIEAEQETERGSNYAVVGDMYYGETESEDYDYEMDS